MYALLNIDTDEYVSSFGADREVYFNMDEDRAKRWKTEDGAQRTLDRLYSKGDLPANIDVRVVEVDYVW